MRKILILLAILMVIDVGFLGGCITNELNTEYSRSSIISFTVEPTVIDYGETANLSWEVEGADIVSIDNGIGTVSNMGKRVIQPTMDTIYTLTAKNSTATINATVLVIVNGGIAPEIQFVKDDINNVLIVTSAEPKNMLWKDIEITGECDTSSLGKYITAGDTIYNCYGRISLRYIPLNMLIGVWDFH